MDCKQKWTPCTEQPETFRTIVEWEAVQALLRESHALSGYQHRSSNYCLPSTHDEQYLFSWFSSSNFWYFPFLPVTSRMRFQCYKIKDKYKEASCTKTWRFIICTILICTRPKLKTLPLTNSIQDFRENDTELFGSSTTGLHGALL